MARRPTRAYTCELCPRPTTRLFGFMLVVRPTGQNAAPSIRTAVHGYCLQHRDQVATGFPSAMRELGEVEMISDPPAELRSDDVADFTTFVDFERARFMQELGVPVQPFDGTLDDPPHQCPHCGATLAWDDGPHVLEAAQRDNARAWVCSGCGAAGILTGRPG